MIAAFARAARLADRPGAIATSTPARTSGALHPDDALAGRVRGRRTDGCCGAIATGEAAIDGYARTTRTWSGACSSSFRRMAIRTGSTGRSSRPGRAGRHCSGTPTDGGWFSTSGRDPTVLLRLKEEHDGAEPSPGSIATLNLIVLSHLTGRGELADRAGRTLARYGQRFGEAARAMPFMLAALATWHAGLEQIVIVGHANAPDTKAMHEAVAREYRPFSVIIPVEPGSRQESAGAADPGHRGNDAPRRPRHGVRLPQLHVRGADH